MNLIQCLKLLSKVVFKRLSIMNITTIDVLLLIAKALNQSVFYVFFQEDGNICYKCKKFNTNSLLDKVHL